MLKEAKCGRDQPQGPPKRSEQSVGCSREGQRGCEGVLPLLEGMKSLALSLQ